MVAFEVRSTIEIKRDENKNTGMIAKDVSNLLSVSLLVNDGSFRSGKEIGVIHLSPVCSCRLN